MTALLEVRGRVEEGTLIEHPTRAKPSPGTVIEVREYEFGGRARGPWFEVVVIEYPDAQEREIGIHLSKDFFACVDKDGERWYRSLDDYGFIWRLPGDES